jgi:hypothetical protein
MFMGEKNPFMSVVSDSQATNEVPIYITKGNDSEYETFSMNNQLIKLD